MIFFSFLIPDQPEPSSREARFVAGDMAAMEEIMALHERGIYQVGLRLFSRADMAADFCQDVFNHIYEKRHKFNPTKPLKPWLFQVALNLGRDRLRRRREIPMEIEQMPETVVETQGENEMQGCAFCWKILGKVPCAWTSLWPLSVNAALDHVG